MRKFQIGVTGSMADLNYADSLSTAACRGAKRKSGLTVGITYGKGKDIVQKDADVIIPCGMERGGGREFVLALSCDAIIALSGGSGTLNELVVAYQADIPMVVLTGMGGWADRLAGEYFDSRNRRQVVAAKTPEEAVRIAFEEAKKYKEKYE